MLIYLRKKEETFTFVEWKPLELNCSVNVNIIPDKNNNAKKV